MTDGAAELEISMTFKLEDETQSGPDWDFQPAASVKSVQQTSVSSLSVVLKYKQRGNMFLYYLQE